MSAFQVTTIDPRPVIYVSRSCKQDSEEIGKTLGSAYGLLMNFAKERGIDVTGQPMTIYHGMNNGIISFDPALPIPASQMDKAGDGGPVKAGHTPSGKAVKAVHKGPYAKLAETYKAIMAYTEENSLKPAGPCYELYVSDPGNTPEDDLITEIYWPVS